MSRKRHVEKVDLAIRKSEIPTPIVYGSTITVPIRRCGNVINVTVKFETFTRGHGGKIWTVLIEDMDGHVQFLSRQQRFNFFHPWRGGVAGFIKPT